MNSAATADYITATAAAAITIAAITGAGAAAMIIFESTATTATTATTAIAVSAVRILTATTAALRAATTHSHLSTPFRLFAASVSLLGDTPNGVGLSTLKYFESIHHRRSDRDSHGNFLQ